MSDLQTNEDHEVLESEYCSGYMDGNGKWKTGFYCPSENVAGNLHCCGTSTHKYCCMQNEAFSEESQFESDLLLVLGIILGITTAVMIVMLASCCFCSCCLLYKKRQGHVNGAGPVYQMHCSSTTSGVANMYSLSGHNSISTQSSQCVVPQIAIPKPIQGHDIPATILGSIVGASHLEVHSSTLQPHTFSEDGFKINSAELHCRQVKESEVSNDDSFPPDVCVQSSMSEFHGSQMTNAGHFILPRLVSVAEEIPNNPLEKQPFFQDFPSYPEKSNGTSFFPTNSEDCCTAVFFQENHVPVSSLTTLVGDKSGAERQEIPNSATFVTRKSPDENLYRSTKF